MGKSCDKAINNSCGKEEDKMAQRKYQKYILTDLILPEDIQEKGPDYDKRATRILWLEDFIIKGAPNIICSWYWKATESEGTPSHTHDFDEVVGFFGADSQNPRKLNGEVEIWLEDEKYNLTESCLIYIPSGLRHCPLRVVRVEKPIFFLAVSLTNNYVQDDVIRAAK